MCGRYTLQTPAREIAEAFGTDNQLDLPLRFNIAPTQNVAAVRAEGGARVLTLLRWGFIPSWAKDPDVGNWTINARSETMTEKPSYRDPFLRRRCLVPADGFYEWQRQGTKKQPYYFRMRDGRPFAFAGLWDRWTWGGEEAESCTILTNAANEVLAPVHGRMSVILAPADYSLWIDPGVRRAELLTPLLQPYAPDEMEARPVSRLVNSPANDDERCVASLTGGA